MASEQHRPRVVESSELPRTLLDYTGEREAEAYLSVALGGRGLWLVAQDAYGIVVAGDTEADVVHCSPHAYVPVEYRGMRRLNAVEDVNDYTEVVVDAPLPSGQVAIFSVRDNVIDEKDWLEQSADGVADYAEVGVALDVPITLIDDDLYWQQQIVPLSRTPYLRLIE